MMDLLLPDSPLWLTLKVAFLATLAAAAAGVSVGFGLARSRSTWGDWLDALLALPLVLPPTVMGYYLIVFLGRKGWLGAWLQAHLGVSLVFTWQGAVVAAAVVSFPLVLKSARAAFEEVDGNLENAARTLGQSETAVFWRVSLPLAWRGIVAGTMLAFARAMGEFGATLMLAGNLPGRTQTLSMAVYEAVQAGDDRRAALLVVLTSLVCIVILVTSSRLLKKGAYLR